MPNKQIPNLPYGIRANGFIYLEQLLINISKNSQSLQVFHFDNNYVGIDLKIELS